jgi:hypothetical protein
MRSEVHVSIVRRNLFGRATSRVSSLCASEASQAEEWMICWHEQLGALLGCMLGCMGTG